MTTLYLIGILLFAISLAAGLAYVAGLAKGRRESEKVIAQLVASRDAAAAARDSLAKQLAAAISAPKSIDEIEQRLREGTA